MWLFWILFKGKFHQDFRPPVFSSLDPVPLTNVLKYFRFWLRFHRIIRVFRDWISAVSYSTALSQSPRSIILRGVTLHILRGVNRHSLNTFAQAIKGKVSQTWLWILIIIIKGYIFQFWTIVLGWNFLLTPRSITLSAVSFIDTKIRITRQKT